MTFSEYYEHYLTLHTNKWCRRLHVLGQLFTIAFVALNITLGGSSDFYFDMGIQATPQMSELPELVDSVGIVFSHNSGFVSSNFNLALNTSVACSVTLSR